MPKNAKKVTKAEAKASIKRLQMAAKRREKPRIEALAPVAVRELPPQHEVKEVPAPKIKHEVKEAPAEKEAPVEEPEEIVEEPEPVHKESGKKVVVGEAIEFGWSLVKSHFWFFVGIFLLFFALSFMMYGAGAIGTRIVLGLLVSGISIGYFKLSLDLADGKSPEFKELFSCFSLLLKYLAANVVYCVVVAVGLALLVVPGIIWAVQFGFFPYVIVSERLGPLSALRKSSSLTVGVKNRLVIFAFALLGINLLGLIPFGLGLILTIPLSVIAVAHVFRQLEKMHSSPQ
jgi:hypothetical protein